MEQFSKGAFLGSLFCLIILSSMYYEIPSNVKRVVLIANVQTPPRFDFRDGDLIIEMNKAVHHGSVMRIKQQAPNVLDFLFVRHTKGEHFLPDNFSRLTTTWDSILLTSPRYGFSTETWFKDYHTKTGKTPTTGFAVYSLIRTRDRRLPIIGLGFNLNDNTTPHCPLHDWEYEYKVYNKDKNFTLVQ